MLSNLERRVVANLSIPRNTMDLSNELLGDPASGFRVDSNIQDLLDDAVANGYVVKLGEHDSPGKAAAHVDKDKKALSMPDEKAQNYEARLLVPHRSWRGKGDLYVMTIDGADALIDPEGVGDPTPLSTAAVEEVMRQELARVHKGKLADQDSVSTGLLEDEFATWAKAVATAHEHMTGERPAMPLSGGAGYSDATELLILDPENGKGSAYTETAPWFMAAVTTAVTDADTGSTITEANYTGYARKSVAAADMNVAAAGAATNANAITFAACTAGTSAVIGFAKCAASTVGRLIKFGTCTLVNVSSTQTPLNFAVGAFTTSLD